MLSILQWLGLLHNVRLEPRDTVTCITDDGRDGSKPLFGGVHTVLSVRKTSDERR